MAQWPPLNSLLEPRTLLLKINLVIVCKRVGRMVREFAFQWQGYGFEPEFT